jgi:hypothetical protein
VHANQQNSSVNSEHKEHFKWQIGASTVVLREERYEAVMKSAAYCSKLSPAEREVQCAVRR